MIDTEKKYGVFISYSHEDAKLLSPIVKLITTVRKDLVFYDLRDILPGKKWQPQLLNALEHIEIVIVFWCKHSAKSIYVRKEYQIAMNQGKDVVPILLDGTKITKALGAYQWIDFRNSVWHENDTLINPLDIFGTGAGLGVIPTISFGTSILGSIGVLLARQMSRPESLISHAILEKLSEKLPSKSSTFVIDDPG